MEHGSRTRLVTALVLAAVLGAGVLLGLAADGNLGAAPAEAVPDTSESEGEHGEPDRRARIYEQVEPTDPQRILIDSIVVEYRALTTALDDRLRAEYSTEFRTILLETREAIKGVLTPDQAAEYQRLLDERDERVAAERENRDEPE
jgi:Spy/CpxP family protein refolding chaperone